MSDSNRGQLLKDRGGLIVAATVATIFAITILSLARGWQWETDYEASHAAANYAAEADKEVRAECGLSRTEARNKCANEIYDAARKNQRDEYDLAAQRTMAIWTAVMGWMAVVGVGLSAVGVFLIWQTWKETERTAASAAKGILLQAAQIIGEPQTGVIFHLQREDDGQWGPLTIALNVRSPPGPTIKEFHIRNFKASVPAFGAEDLTMRHQNGGSIRFTPEVEYSNLIYIAPDFKFDSEGIMPGGLSGAEVRVSFSIFYTDALGDQHERIEEWQGFMDDGIGHDAQVNALHAELIRVSLKRA